MKFFTALIVLGIVSNASAGEWKIGYGTAKKPQGLHQPVTQLVSSTRPSRGLPSGVDRALFGGMTASPTNVQVSYARSPSASSTTPALGCRGSRIMSSASCSGRARISYSGRSRIVRDRLLGWRFRARARGCGG